MDKYINADMHKLFYQKCNFKLYYFCTICVKLHLLLYFYIYLCISTFIYFCVHMLIR